MQTISVTDFKAHALKKISDVAHTRLPLILTKRGQPFVQVIPWSAESPSVSPLKGSVLFEGDIVSPAVTPEEFEAAQ